MKNYDKILSEVLKSGYTEFNAERQPVAGGPDKITLSTDMGGIDLPATQDDIHYLLEKHYIIPMHSSVYQMTEAGIEHMKHLQDA